MELVDISYLVCTVWRTNNPPPVNDVSLSAKSKIIVELVRGDIDCRKHTKYPSVLCFAPTMSSTTSRLIEVEGMADKVSRG